MKKIRNKKSNRKILTAVIIVFTVAAASLLIYYNACFSPVDVVIDPGHGGSDVGAEYDGRYEKDDNLKLSLKINEILKSRGISTALTRDSDKFISLENRCKLANKRRAKIFVAVHRNSGEGASGVEIWIESKGAKAEKQLASQIMFNLSQAGISSDRGVKRGYAQGDGDYYVNKHTNMKSCLIELGFINSNKDNSLFDENLDEYAQAIANAIYDDLKKDG